MTRSARAGLAVALLAATGCASVPMMPEADDLAGKAFAKPAADKAHVYVYRNENFGAAVKLSVLVDGFQAAETAAKVYVLLPVEPGSHVVSSVAEDRSEVTIDAVAGQTYFVWQEVKMGMLSARSKLTVVDPATGKAGVQECKRAQATLPPPGLKASQKPAAVPAS
jgi:hypothetical protein